MKFKETKNACLYHQSSKYLHNESIHNASTRNSPSDQRYNILWFIGTVTTDLSTIVLYFVKRM
jgi:dsRNA-specific ribonuclease